MQTFRNTMILLLLVALLGCDSTAERLYKEQIEMVNESADRMESGHWDAVYGQNVSARMTEILNKQQKLKISPEEKKQLEEKYGPEMLKARARFKTASEKRSGRPRKSQSP